MPTWLYLACWLAAALLLIGFASAGIAKQLKLRDLRRRQGLLLLDALERYSEWVAAQRHAPVFQGESAEVAQALDEATTLRMAWFPELGSDMAELLGIHARLLHFLSMQGALRERDAEAWLETDHDGRFMALWRQLHAVHQTMQAKLALLGVVLPEPPAAVLPAHYAQRESNA